MTEQSLIRRYTFKLYPNGIQLEALERQRQMHCELYNALLQQRIEAYQRQGKSLTYFDQTAEITRLRNDPEIGAEWSEMSASAMHATAQRLDRAFKAFFDRARKGMGAQAGFPRFRGWRHFPGISFKQPGSGWNLTLKPERNSRPGNGRLHVKGVPGVIKARGRLPCEPQASKTCELCWRENRWWLSLVVEMPPRRQSGQGTGRIRFDLVDSFCGVTRMNGGRTAGPERVWFAREGRIHEAVQ
jgi:putative transposase